MGTKFYVTILLVREHAKDESVDGGIIWIWLQGNEMGGGDGFVLTILTWHDNGSHWEVY